MNLPEPYRKINKKQDVIDVFGGFNNTEDAKKNEFSHMKNVSHAKFPSIVPRKPRELLQTLVKPNGILSFKDALYTVDGTSFKKDGVSKGTVTDSKKCMIEFNQFILIFPDKKFYDTVGGTFGSFANGTIVTSANPDIDKATVHNNRVFGVKGSNVYATKQGDFKEWNVFDQLLTDSWATDVAGAVSFSTIGTYQNHVVMQSEKNMFELYGYNPSNFQIQETIKIGSNVFSYTELNSILYFANVDGLFAYSGGVPRRLSQSIDIPLQSAELGSDGRYLYASVFDGANKHLFVYDSETRLITREDDLNVVQFTLHDGHMLALCADGKVYKFDSGTEVVDWELETVEIRDDYFVNKGLKRLELHAEMSPSSMINLFVEMENVSGYTHVGTFLAETSKNLLLPVNLSQNCYKIKITGRGYVKINAIRRTIIGGGRI